MLTQILGFAFRRPFIAASIAAACSLSGCTKPDAAPESGAQAAQVYHVRGVLRAINFASQSVTVQHEDIPNYMPAMTMPFDVKSMTDVQPYSAGDPIGFDLVVTDKSSWIENVRKIDAVEVKLPSAAGSTAAVGANAVERLKEGDKLPALDLVDQKGARVTADAFAGRPLLLTFIFTRCPIPNFCPLMSQNFQRIQAALSEQPGQGGAPRYLSISFDPDFDTPQVLAQYAARYVNDGVDWRFATGSKAEVEKLTKAFSVYTQSENGTISHGLCTALVGADGVILKLWRGNSWDPSEAVSALRDAAAASASPSSLSVN